jgi:hypothetical protein
MILNIINRRPNITFGLGKVEATITLGETIKVWQTEVFDSKEFVLNSIGVNETVGGFEYTPTSIGEVELSCNVISRARKINKVSNRIKLTVI